ncbi:MAG: hypothetical protein M3Q58_00470 [Bacteroidota bacterium]|nr:hypothetical protein [Bacteroidota bacterium]
MCFIFLMLLLIMAIMPKGGININGDLVLKFPTLTAFFIPDTVKKKDIAFIIDDTPTEPVVLTSNPDPADNYKDSLLLAKQDSLRKSLLKLQYPENNKSVLFGFFKKLNQASKNGSQVRIMHYGDSQLEGDRITGVLRQNLQTIFSGDGPGIFPVIPIARKEWSNNQYSENWKRYTGFGKIDSTVNHKNYGALLNFSRFTGLQPDSLLSDTSFHYAWIEIKPSKKSQSKSTVFREITMYYDNCSVPVFIRVYKDNEFVSEDLLMPTNELTEYKISFDSPASSIKITFKAKLSPDILGFSVSSNNGVIADNIPIRGGSGTEFSKVNKQHFSKMLKMLKPDLFIMQFGGNVLPYIDSEEKCKNYGEWLESHLRMVKKMVPDADLILIGPADMSIKSDNEFITHPYLETVRDALKQAAFNTGSAYWDMYEAMGGKNSMPIWVSAEPSLAAKDYIHFSPKGAVKIAGMFYETLYNDFKNWKQLQNEQQTP